MNAADGEGFAAQGATGWLCSILTDSGERRLDAIARARAAMDADLVVLDGALDVRATYVAGREVWSAL